MNNASDRRTTVGVLSLDGTLVTGPGSLYDPALLAAPVEQIVVPGAMTTVVVSAPEKVRTAYEDSAHLLAARGCGMLVSNCGLSVGHQSAVSAVAGVPTVMSSLLVVPLLWRVFGGGLGILTYDAAALATPAVREACGWTDDIRPVIGEVCTFASWRCLEGDDVPLPVREMESDLVTVVDETVARGADRALLVECTAMLPYTATIRCRSGLPTFDITGLVTYIRDELDRSHRV